METESKDIQETGAEKRDCDDSFSGLYSGGSDRAVYLRNAMARLLSR